MSKKKKYAVIKDEQLNNYRSRQEAYLKEKQFFNNGGHDEYELNAAQKAMAQADIDLHQRYLESLPELYEATKVGEYSFNEETNTYHEDMEYNYDARVRLIDVSSIVVDSNENNINKLSNVYRSIMGENCNVALIYQRNPEQSKLFLGLSNQNEEFEPSFAEDYLSRMESSLHGNFPGIKTERIGNDNFLDYNPKRVNVASVSVIAGEQNDKFNYQSMDKILDGFVPKNNDESYSVVLIAEPINELRELKDQLFQYYNAIYPFGTIQRNDQIGDTITHTAGASLSQTSGWSIGGGIGGGATGQSFNPFGSINVGFSFFTTLTDSTSISNSLNESKGVTRSYENFYIQNILDHIKKQVERIENGESSGAWRFAAYVISESPEMAQNVANAYRSLIAGPEAFMSRTSVNIWRAKSVYDSKQDDLKNILSAIRGLRHPVFRIKEELINEDDKLLLYPSSVTATTSIFGNEVACALNLPEKSVGGIPVMQVASFGREEHSLREHDSNLDLGCSYHMHSKEVNRRIRISSEELTKHMFVTGSTGFGKTNTICHILDKLVCQEKAKVKFLIIEPAKGEYKDIIGKRTDVDIYGTNPLITEMNLLRLNPFRFPKHTHVLEHLDRLVEIFNVCWPMYAAMPAILKEAIQNSYIDCGWDIEKSTCKYNVPIFPDFNDVCIQVKKIVSESDYSAENKGDYVGALVTRLRSLTTGINKLIFSNDDVDDYFLFDSNVIVDLSRIESETKSLIMGLLIIKLKEYRMEQRDQDEIVSNNELRHITVLEEAHNILRRTSYDQPTEGSNLIGKSVEMLANSIAEMRTFGEGFIIADQAPGLMDESVIRNTNTKIIMRLPDYSDRVLVGKASGFNNDQIDEAGRFERGVAAITQSDWIEPVLCMIDEYIPPVTNHKKNIRRPLDEKIVLERLVNIIMNNEILRSPDHKEGSLDKLNKVCKLILNSNLSSRLKVDCIDYINEGYTEERLSKLIYDLFNVAEVIKMNKDFSDIKDWSRLILNEIKPSISNYSAEQKEILLKYILNEQMKIDTTFTDVYKRFTTLKHNEGRVI